MESYLKLGRTFNKWTGPFQNLRSKLTALFCATTTFGILGFLGNLAYNEAEEKLEQIKRDDDELLEKRALERYFRHQPVITYNRE